MFRAVDNYPSLKAFSGDAGYRGTAVDYAKEKLNMTLHISEKIKGEFAVLPKRWVVERTFSWLAKRRSIATRWCKKPQNWLAFVHMACAQILLNIILG